METEVFAGPSMAGAARVGAEGKRRTSPLSATNRAVKRGFDLLLATVSTVFFAPLCLLISVAIWLEDRHSPVFRQERVGLHGKKFMIYKFRTMTVESESDNVPQLCSDHDNRLTKVGAFLRAHHLDEFLQLWNVLRGDMSFVGPRPERQYFIDQIMEVAPQYEQLYQIRPGVFSKATLYNGYTDTMEKMLRRLRMDLEYLENQSLWLDIKIIWLTAWAIISGSKF